MFIKRMRLITICNANVSMCDYCGDEVRASDQNGRGSIASSCWINLIDVMSSNDALHSVLFHDLDTFNTRNARTRSMAPPSMSKPFLLSAHSLLSACFLLSAYFLAVHSHKRMRLTTSVYGTWLISVRHCLFSASQISLLSRYKIQNPLNHIITYQSRVYIQLWLTMPRYHP